MRDKRERSFTAGWNIKGFSSDLKRFQQRSTVRSPYALLKRPSLNFAFIFTSKNQIHLGDNLEDVILHRIDISDASFLPREKQLILCSANFNFL